MLTMSYNVKNTSKEDVVLRVDDHPVERHWAGRHVDTTIVLHPGTDVAVGWADGIGFPWDTKKLFKERRASWNFKVLRNDSIVEMTRDDRKWRYHNRRSVYKLTN